MRQMVVIYITSEAGVARCTTLRGGSSLHCHFDISGSNRDSYNFGIHASHFLLGFPCTVQLCDSSRYMKYVLLGDDDLYEFQHGFNAYFRTRRSVQQTARKNCKMTYVKTNKLLTQFYISYAA